MNGIEITNLNVDFGKFTLQNINLTVPQGTVMGLIGRNGAGKSTLIKCAADSCDYSGEVKINGITAYGDRVTYFSQMAVVFDELMFNDELKVKDLLERYEKVYPKFDGTFFSRYLDFFHIERKTKLCKLSFGMKKKLQLIAVMSLRPQTLILDEPTTGIDPADRSEIIDMLADFMLDENHTVLLSTHITSDLDKIADYITLLDDGKIIFSDSKDNLQDRYRLIRAESGTLTPSECEALIGVKYSAFGTEGLTDRKDIYTKPSVTAVIPTVEEIMLAFTERED
ncbi:MAG: ABC transporter ATP-binding protein [Ruminococcus sp.]|nr:ABC transporter ATP-binding protein [Ruminococcus sp.]